MLLSRLKCALMSLHSAQLQRHESHQHLYHSAGTTTATVLTRAIVSEGCKSVAAGLNPMDLRRGISLAVDHVVADLKKRAKPISTTEEIAQAGLLCACCSCGCLH